MGQPIFLMHIPSFTNRQAFELGPVGMVDAINFTRLRSRSGPNNEELKSVVDALFQFCNPRMVNILSPWIIIELRVDDQRTYEAGALPKRIGGFAAHYYHSLESVLEGLPVQGRERVISPTPLAQDNSDYL